MIDDEADFCLSVKKNLEEAGDFKVAVCVDSEEALSMAQEWRPDLILLDILMPKVSGPEIAEQLSRHAQTRSIPIVFLTAVVMGQETAGKGNLIGGRYFVAKPVKINELLKVIDAAAA